MGTKKQTADALPVAYNEQLERAALGCAFIDPSCVPVMAKALDEADFFLPHNRDAFTAILAVHNERGTVDEVLAGEKLRELFQTPTELRFIYLQTFRDDAVSPLMLSSYIDDLKKLSIEREQNPGNELPKYNEWRATLLFRARNPLIRCVGTDWFAYSDGAWNKTDRHEFRPAAQSVITALDRTEKREAAILRHTEGAQQIRADQLRGFYRKTDRQILVNVANGILQITKEGVEKIPHDPAHMFTLKTAGAMTGELCPLFERVLMESLPDPEDQELFKLMAGSFLLPDSSHEAALVCYGLAGTGKSTLMEAVSNAIGAQLIGRLKMSQLCDSKSYHLSALKFAAFNLGTELDSLEIEDSAAFKAMCSGEEMTIRDIYGKPFLMKSTAKLVFLSNNMPRFKNGTGGEVRRMRFLQFDRQPATKDPTLKDRLNAERDGILAWVVNGLIRLLDRGEMPMGGAVSRATHDRFAVSNDPIASFIGDRCELRTDSHTEKDHLTNAFQDYCENQGIPDAIVPYFLPRLYSKYPGVKPIRPRTAAGRIHAVKGIALREEAFS